MYYFYVFLIYTYVVSYISDQSQRVDILYIKALGH